MTVIEISTIDYAAKLKTTTWLSIPDSLGCVFRSIGFVLMFCPVLHRPSMAPLMRIYFQLTYKLTNYDGTTT